MEYNVSRPLEHFGLPFEVGDTVRTLDYVATVTQVDDGRATAVRFRFRAALNHESFVWATWAEDEFVAISPAQFCRQSSD